MSRLLGDDGDYFKVVVAIIGTTIRFIMFHSDNRVQPFLSHRLSLAVAGFTMSCVSV
jgi:hypothetical protein